MSLLNMMLGGGLGGSADIKISTANASGTAVTFSIENAPHEYILLPYENARNIPQNTRYIFAVADTVDYKALCYFYYTGSATQYDTTTLSPVATSYSDGSFTLMFTGYTVFSGECTLFYW